jgi:hypothetical protein
LITSGIVGPTGFQGSTGFTGPQGVTGQTGPQGIQGVTGQTGPQGVTGQTGPQGIQGVTGQTGPQGVTGQTGQKGGFLYRYDPFFPPATGEFEFFVSEGDTYAIRINETTLNGEDLSSFMGQLSLPLTITIQSGFTGNYFEYFNITNIVDDGSYYTFSCDIVTTSAPSLSSLNVINFIQKLTGPTGPTGPQGVTGQTGPQGPQGTTGQTGAVGPTGPAASLSAGSYTVKGVKGGASQTITSGSDVVVTFVDDFDPQNWLSSNKIQPTIAGYYILNAQVWWDAGSVTNNQSNIQFRKNGSTQVSIHQTQILSGSGYAQEIDTVAYLNGTTDYVEVTAFTGNPTSQNINAASSGTWFTASLLTVGSGPTGSAGAAGPTGPTGSAGLDFNQIQMIAFLSS